MYTAELARRDYEKNNITLIRTRRFIKWAEQRIEEKAKQGGNKYSFSFVDDEYFEECIPGICEYLTKNGFFVQVYTSLKGYQYIIVEW